MASCPQWRRGRAARGRGRGGRGGRGGARVVLRRHHSHALRRAAQHARTRRRLPHPGLRDKRTYARHCRTDGLRASSRVTSRRRWATTRCRWRRRAATSTSASTLEGSLYCIGQRKFPTLEQLVAHYQRAPIYTNKQGEKLYLVRPLPKATQPCWAPRRPERTGRHRAGCSLDYWHKVAWQVWYIHFLQNLFPYNFESKGRSVRMCIINYN